MRWLLVGLLTVACTRARAVTPDAGQPVRVTNGEGVGLRAQFASLDAGFLNDELEHTATALSVRLGAVSPVDRGAVWQQLQQRVAENLEAKRAAGFPLQVERIRREVIGYEAFKMETFVATGVFPKRYFGYLDEAWDTARYETRLKTVARASVRACNRWLETQRAAFRVTEQEIVVTFLAEGGAVLLREHQDQLESIDPVKDIGLDDIAKGFVDLAPLVALLDSEAGTRLGEIVLLDAGPPRLSRMFTFEEAVAGTAAMWVWEKRIAEQKLAAEERPSLSTRPLDEQFVITSLVYNSGILFNQKTIDAVRSLSTGDMMFELSERSKAKRWALPVMTSKRSLQWVLDGEEYPAQGTSWATVYHVLQRTGAYVALTRFTDDFDERGALRP